MFRQQKTSRQRTVRWALSLAIAAATLAGPAQAQPLSSLSHIHGIAVPADPADGLYLATHNGFFLATSDGNAELVAPITDDFMALTPDPSDSRVLYASGHPRGGGNLGLLKSDDGGHSWNRVSTGLNGPVDFHALTISPVDPQRIYGMFRGLQVSRDGGQSWSMGTLPAGVRALAGSSLSADTLYAATDKGLKISPDGGQRWRPAMMMQLPATLAHVAADGQAYTFLVGKGLMSVQESERGWQPLFNGFGEAIPVQITSDRSNPQRLFMLDHLGQLWRSGDGGHAWQPFVGGGN